ncbi:hypothetical protein N7466_004300 [Penicillium verhagenii]|uniref:uncharacterized protein n=1 Tax=Penicillium verhagenii TaxID=1562060 RepID=UPI0025454D3A|nr:uncharacterized protein N7466_004300 [Penicillium verhagenii]KAJ5934753.1 hypothetical protein N7466_004300 [Penicillium verhagenii]
MTLKKHAQYSKIGTTMDMPWKIALNNVKLGIDLWDLFTIRTLHFRHKHKHKNTALVYQPLNIAHQGTDGQSG